MSAAVDTFRRPVWVQSPTHLLSLDMIDSQASNHSAMRLGMFSHFDEEERIGYNPQPSWEALCTTLNGQQKEVDPSCYSQNL